MILRSEYSNTFLFGTVFQDCNLLLGFLFSFENCLQCVVESFSFKNISYILENWESDAFSFKNCKGNSFKKMYSISIDLTYFNSNF